MISFLVLLNLFKMFLFDLFVVLVGSLTLLLRALMESLCMHPIMLRHLTR